MDNSIDSDSDQSQNREARYLEFIELLIDKSTKRLKSESFYGELRTNKPRIQDALRAIRLKDKVFKTSEGEKAIWDLIEEVRQEELPKMYPKPEPVDLESEIRNTILELRFQVENGILPVKSITDAFNQGRSPESQLTYHRVGQILSEMGFRKSRTNTGSYAILWDDKLLMLPPSSHSQNELSDLEEDEKYESESPVSPVNPVSPVSPEIGLHSALRPETDCRRKPIYPKGSLPPKVFGWRPS